MLETQVACPWRCSRPPVETEIPNLLRPHRSTLTTVTARTNAKSLPLTAWVDVSLMAAESSGGNVSKLMSSIIVPRTHLELASRHSCSGPVWRCLGGLMPNSGWVDTRRIARRLGTSFATSRLAGSRAGFPAQPPHHLVQPPTRHGRRAESPSPYSASPTLGGADRRRKLNNLDKMSTSLCPRNGCLTPV